MAAWNFCLLYHSEVMIDYYRIKYLVYYSVAKYNCVLEICFKLYLYNVLIPKDLHLSLSSLVILKHNLEMFLIQPVFTHFHDSHRIIYHCSTYFVSFSCDCSYCADWNCQVFSHGAHRFII